MGNSRRAMPSTHTASARPLPPDGGCAAWLRVFAYALICICTLGVQYAFSPLYALLLTELGSPPAETAFVGSLSTGLMDGLAIFSGMAVERWGYQRTCIVGALLCSGGLAAAAVSSELWQLYLTYGVMLGIGCSLSLFSGIVIMNRWFQRNLAVAHALANMASSLLALGLGPTAKPIFASIGRRNAMFAMAGFELVVLLFSAGLLTTPRGRSLEEKCSNAAEPAAKLQAGEERHALPHPAAAADAAAAAAAATGASKRASKRASNGAVDTHSDAPDRAEEEQNEDAQSTSSPFHSALRRPAIQLMLVTESFYGLAAWTPVVHLGEFGSQTIPPHTHHSETSSPIHEARARLQRASSSLFTSPFLPFGARPSVRLSLECGLSTQEANTRLTFLALGSLTLRVPLAAIGDRFGRRRVFLCCALAYGSLCIATAFAAGGDGCLNNGDPTANTIYLSCFAYMCGLTGVMNTLSVSLPTELGISRDEARAGASLMCTPFGLAFMVGPVIAGAMHGIRNRYREPMIFAGGSLFICAALTALSLRLHGDASPAVAARRKLYVAAIAAEATQPLASQA